MEKDRFLSSYISEENPELGKISANIKQNEKLV